ncbi:guanylate cyclase [uncultured Adlercreutzia sp.]|uniref:guanylate cyclase n=1 Tax=uncultured Adlercreutzia sp. TaxID=875803 RepID=UPI0026F3DD66|nr:guanylate cyclase [uncultured Adlercreutzia sp.]
MGLLARLSRVVPLILALAVAAGLIYVVVTYRHSPARAKEVLIRVFTWLCGIISGFFALVSLYAFFDDAPPVLDLALSFMAVGLVGLAITRLCNWRFLKHNPHYRKKRLTATTKRRWPWERYTK